MKCFARCQLSHSEEDLFTQEYGVDDAGAGSVFELVDRWKDGHRQLGDAVEPLLLFLCIAVTLGGAVKAGPQFDP